MIGGLFEATCNRPSDIQGHLRLLRDLVVELDAQVVVELGVRWGRSTVALLAGVEQTGGRLWSCDVDPATHDWVPDEVRSHPQWSFSGGDDLDMVENVPRPIDLLFVDTSHEYGHTLAELHMYGPLVRPGGAVVLHDTDPVRWPDCARAVKDWFDADAPAGARLEFHPGDNGLTLVRLAEVRDGMADPR